MIVMTGMGRWKGEIWSIKRANPQKGFALIEKRYHTDFKALIFTLP